MQVRRLTAWTVIPAVLLYLQRMKTHINIFPNNLKKDEPKVEKYFITLTAEANEKGAEAEAAKLNARAAGKEFEISSYKYEGMFKPLEELLEKK